MQPSRHKVAPQIYPLFKRSEARFSFPSGGITHMTCSGGVVTLVMIGNIIYRLNTTNSKSPERKYMYIYN